MKSEDLIDKYIGSNEWENPYHTSEYNLYEVEEPPPDDDPADPNPWNDDRKVWLNLRKAIVEGNFRQWSYSDIEDNEPLYQGYYDVEGQDTYRFIRKILEKITNPYGGYLYRRNHYLGYVGSMGLLFPEGFEVAKEENFMAQNGSIVPDIFDRNQIKLLRSMGLIELERKGQSRGGSLMPAGNYFPDPHVKSKDVYRFVKKAWNERYVLVSSSYVNYPYYYIDDLINAAISDLYMVKLKKTVMGTTRKYTNSWLRVEKDFDYWGAADDVYAYNIDKRVMITQKPYQKTFLALGWLISEMLLAFKYWKKFKSMIPYPVFPNFGFMGTIPTPIIDANLGAVVDLLDYFFKTKGYGIELGRGRGFGYQETDPVVSYINSSAGDDGGTPPPDSPRGGRGYQE